ncbi:spermidine synthase [Allofranklinella schreckenbergeri]|uniref:Spermidine synthase n=1 Tax=Allofranklinella schreckenbergeri TaxID=1076744 RepID=A0A3M6QFQ9_9BURK|nr:spermidine synthase [Allofranklinella schreckenbergeri]RMX01322.1 spermidine synthase [Allofranklinella schreckenbergeri]
MPHTPACLPDVSISEEDGVRHLHLDSPWIQGSMRIARPIDIELEYVQRMMAWLLFVPPDEVAERHAMQLGLGAAALTKFCYRRLGMRTTTIELNPQVVAACMRWFRLPANDERLQVLVANAADAVQDPDWHASVDALQVDLYDHEAAGPVLESAEFYRHCWDMLVPGGCMSVNLFGRSASFERNMRHIASAFGPHLWHFKPTREGNTVILARRQPQDVPMPVLRERAEEIERRWKLPARLWVHALQTWRGTP